MRTLTAGAVIDADVAHILIPGRYPGYYPGVAVKKILIATQDATLVGTYPGSGTNPDGDIGRTRLGPVNDGDYGGYRTATQFTPSHAGTLTTIGIWVTVSGGPVTARAIVYADSGGTPGALLSVSADQAIPNGGPQEVIFPGFAVAVAAGTPIWLAFGADSSTCQVFCEALGTGAHSFRSGSAAADPFGFAAVSSSAGDNSIWAYIGVADSLSVPGRGNDLGAIAPTPNALSASPIT